MKFSALFGCLFAGLAVLGVAQAQPVDPIIIKFSHVVKPDTPKGKGADYFKRLAEQRTQGRVKVEVFHNGTLYKDKDEMAALQKGEVQMLAPSLSKFGSMGLASFELFDLPYIFPSPEVLRAVTDGPIGKGLLKSLESKGLLGLAYWDNGFKIFSANKEIKLPTDAKGLKMRIQSSDVLQAYMDIMGAESNRKLNFSDVSKALETGTIDGTENPPSNMFTQGMDKVQKYAIVTNHGYLGYAVVTNKAFWDSLPQDIRVILEEALDDSTHLVNAIAKQENDDSLAAMIDAKSTTFYFPMPEQAKIWRDTLSPVQKTAASRVGADLIQAINQISEKSLQ